MHGRKAANTDATVEMLSGSGVQVHRVSGDLSKNEGVQSVIDGVRAHTWKIEPGPATPEGMLLRYADRIAYLTHDALDAMRAGLLTADAFPPAMTERFGPPTSSAWIGGMIDAVVEGTLEAGEVRMRDDVLADMNELRDFMFERVYLSPVQRRPQAAAIDIIRRLMDHHLVHPEDIPASYRDNDADRVVQAADYIAGMTDRFALLTHERLFGEDGMGGLTI